MDIKGEIGIIRVEIIIIGDKHVIRFGCLNCQVIFVLFDVGNIVSEVVYVIRV